MAVVRVSAIAETIATDGPTAGALDLLRKAIHVERGASHNWQEVSRSVGA